MKTIPIATLEEKVARIETEMNVIRLQAALGGGLTTELLEQLIAIMRSDSEYADYRARSIALSELSPLPIRDYYMFRGRLDQLYEAAEQEAAERGDVSWELKRDIELYEMQLAL